MTRVVWLLPVLLSILAAGGCGRPEPGETTSAAVPTSTPEPNAQPTAAEGPFWSTYHGPPSLDGVADVALPAALKPVWYADVGAPVVNPPVTGPDRICVADAKGGVHAFDWKGNEAWSRTFTEPSGPSGQTVPITFDAPLALFESTLVACAAGGEVYALDLADGTTRWMTDTGLPILGTPNLARVTIDGQARRRLFVIDQSDGALQCLDFSDGRKLWTAEGVGRCDGSPAASDDWVVFGSCACALHVFSTSSPEMVREVALDEDSQIAGGAVVLGDAVFSSSRSGTFVHADARTGQVIWSNSDCKGESFSTPAVDEHWVLFTADDGMVYALDRKTGTLKWTRELESTPSSPVIARDKVVVSAGGTLYLLRLADGEILWSSSVSDEITAPSMAGSMVVVGSGDGTVTAFR